MPPGAQVHQRAASLVFIRFEEVSVGRCSRVPADGEGRAGEVAAKADVERDVRVIGVHVETQILAALYFTMNEWWPVNPPSACVG
eukprot:CAMPEP_0181183414 /NCGR_PEP_ID=MMETSP1096-20121128/8413_1 /TAXON_ID=156174 ORGANISM="Chrysochromulina ericina, Strain CCMP281" /NCGR_SAMPLE_ID=MMETSP1096 /ASSEMBLY_ACC=CAM_ASM_000453 /LENGTH=84 /DNA_ID=CAMNT_0023272093 /DNA_START=1104 /DNA_END=1359 /DNA_ORIENTATION=-